MLIPRNTEQAELVARIRQEADDARGCFRTMATQALIFVPAGVGTIIVAMRFATDAALASLGLLISVMAIQRVAIHKFSTSNRNHGYQLHLERLAVSDSNGLRHIGWEEMCRAWRIVQATVFRATYTTPQRWPFRSFTALADLAWWYYRLRAWYRGYADDQRRGDIQAPPDVEVELPCWWLQHHRVENVRSKESCEPASYHAGSYLQRMFSILEKLQVLCLLPLVLAVTIESGGGSDATLVVTVWWYVLLLASALVLMGLHHDSVSRRRQILEDEMLSIHSCAIMWKAVAMAHQRAWSGTNEDRRRYTERLTFVACWLARDVRFIRRFIDLQALPAEWALGPPTDEAVVSAYLTSPE